MHLNRCVSLVALLAAVTVQAAMIPPLPESICIREKQLAQRRIGAAMREAERLRKNLKPVIALLDVELSETRARQEALSRELLSAMSQDDALAARATQAELVAAGVRLDAADGEKALALKRLEEIDKERDVWIKRAAMFDFALRSEMKVMLAGADEIAEREKRVEDARRDVENQAAQIRKYASRRAGAFAKYRDLATRIAETADRRMAVVSQAGFPPAGTYRRWLAALDQELIQRRRAADVQREWIIMNKLLEDRARRNLAFARIAQQVSQSHADALARKAAVLLADEAQSRAVTTDAAVSAYRKEAAPALKSCGDLAEAARGEVDAVMRTLGEAATVAAQADARARYGLAQQTRERHEAAKACFEELIELQKANVAYAKEKADRARSAAEPKNLGELEQERRMRLESARTSEQYVISLRTLVRKLDQQAADDCARIAASRTDIAGFRAAAETLVVPPPNQACQPASEILSSLNDIARQAAVAAGAPAVDDQVATLLFRTANRRMLAERLCIAEEWLAGTRDYIRGLDQQAAVQLWRQGDQRLAWNSVVELAGLGAVVVSDLGFAADNLQARYYALNISRRHMSLLAGATVVFLLLALMIRCATPASRLQWFAAPVIAVLALATFVKQAGLYFFPWASRAGMFIEAFYFSFILWYIVRRLLLLSCPERRWPSAGSFLGAWLAMVRFMLNTTLVLMPVWHVSGISENSWNTRPVVLHLWFFCACFAGSRLLLHPVLLGRFLNRLSKRNGMRLAGAFAAIICNSLVLVAVFPILAGLDNLGLMIGRVVIASFALLIAALIVNRVIAWVLGRLPQRAQGRRLALHGIKAVAWLALVAIAAVVWWRLLGEVLLAPNAPPPVRRFVLLFAGYGRDAVRFWHRGIGGGMTIGSLVRGLAVFALSFWLARVAKSLFRERVLARTPMDENTRQTFAAIVGYLVIITGFLVGLNVAGSSLQNLALLAGAITVGLGFGLQNVINNFVSSLLIHFGRTIRVGDMIEAAGIRGHVREIGLRNTMIQTDDGVTVLVPNGTFVSANITNWTNPEHKLRLHLPVTVPRTADLGAASDLLIATARGCGGIIAAPEPSVEIRVVAADKITLELMAWTDRPKQMASIMGGLNFAVDGALRGRGWLA